MAHDRLQHQTVLAAAAPIGCAEQHTTYVVSSSAWSGKLMQSQVASLPAQHCGRWPLYSWPLSHPSTQESAAAAAAAAEQTHVTAVAVARHPAHHNTMLHSRHRPLCLLRPSHAPVTCCYRVGKQVVNVPSFMVRVDSQKHIDFALTSPFGGGRPGRIKRRNMK